MPKTRDRVPGPSPGPFCPGCGFEWPVVTSSTTTLDHLEHAVAHLEWQAAQRSPHRVVTGAQLLAAYRALLPELRAVEKVRRHALGRRIVDLELDVEAVRFDLKVAYELVDDLKADLAGRDG